MEFFTISLLNGVSYGLLLFMLSSGLTLIFSMMGVLNFAHASFYMLGAYFAYRSRASSASGRRCLAPLLVGLLGALFERSACAGCTSSAMCRAAGHLRPVLPDAGGGAAGLGALGGALWPARAAAGPAVHRVRHAVPKSRAFMMLVALLMLVASGCC
jgi:branched-chain amino acid transport system permease protein